MNFTSKDTFSFTPQVGGVSDVLLLAEQSGIYDDDFGRKQKQDSNILATDLLSQIREKTLILESYINQMQNISIRLSLMDFAEEAFLESRVKTIQHIVNVLKRVREEKKKIIDLLSRGQNGDWVSVGAGSQGDFNRFIADIPNFLDNAQQHMENIQWGVEFMNDPQIPELQRVESVISIANKFYDSLNSCLQVLLDNKELI
ncbi:MAG: hypothetical protein EZS28_019741 [Streblomastix strix]|uniref:Uncharacterized protein n=1 Tax=Streblomastix strix TaxID=222440 RepID=A0A5J4VQ55_9EUKA|nr:MAG: hypothetical protein EZS28_019741 [Streblomastix strix]